MNSFNFLNYHRRDVCNRLVCAQSVHSGGHGARNGLHIMSYNELYGKAPCERGTFFRFQVYTRVEISLAEVYETVGKCVISVSKKAQKDKAHDHVVHLS